MYSYLILIILFCTECYDKTKRNSKGRVVVPIVDNFDEDKFISDINYQGKDGVDVGVNTDFFGKPEYNMVHLLKNIAINGKDKFERRDDGKLYSAKLSDSTLFLSLGHSQIASSEKQLPILTFEQYDGSADHEYTVSQSLLNTSYLERDDLISLNINKKEFGRNKVVPLYLRPSKQKDDIDAEFSSRNYIFLDVSFKAVDANSYNETKLRDLLSSDREVEVVKYIAKIKFKKTSRKDSRSIEVSVDKESEYNRAIVAKLATLNREDVTILGELGAVVLDDLHDLTLPFLKSKDGKTFVIKEGEIANQAYIVPDSQNEGSFLCYITVVLKSNDLPSIFTDALKDPKYIYSVPILQLVYRIKKR